MIVFDLNKCVSSAYKEKVKELPLVSLFCSCLNPQTTEKPTYKAEGKRNVLHTDFKDCNHHSQRSHVILGDVNVKEMLVKQESTCCT